MTKSNSYNGGCTCGYIRFTAIGEPQNPHTCSCKTCQTQSGALTIAWVEFPKESVSWTGEGGEPSKYRTSDFSSRSFCPKCGSYLGAIDDAPIIALLVGSFDNKDSIELIPVFHSYVTRRPKWWNIHIEGKKETNQK